MLLELARRLREGQIGPQNRDHPPASVLLNPGKPPRGKVNFDTEAT
jgi:hypothetical protein